MRSGVEIRLGPGDRERLEAVVADRNNAQKHVWRARIILATAEGCGTAEIMRRAGVSKPCVWRWQRRFMEAGVDGLLHDKTRKPGKAPIPEPVVAELIALTLGAPPGETTHWTSRAMAEAIGLAVSTVQKIWHAHGLAPHRLRVFKLSPDPQFAAKLRDVVGPGAGPRPDPWVDPPAHSLVLSVDEKSQVQAPDLAGLGVKVAVTDLNLRSYEEFEAEAKDMTADSTVAEIETAGGTALAIGVQLNRGVLCREIAYAFNLSRLCSVQK